jgi:hypothetical protein
MTYKIVISLPDKKPLTYTVDDYWIQDNFIVFIDNKDKRGKIERYFPQMHSQIEKEVD